jgi:hypothetical protein
MKPKTEKEKKKEPPKKEEKCICEICTCGYVATDSYKRGSISKKSKRALIVLKKICSLRIYVGHAKIKRISVKNRTL